MSFPSFLEVNLQCLRNNIRVVKKMTTKDLYFVLKSQAYGLGGLPVVQTLIEEKCFKIAVLSIHEALQYKQFFSKDLKILLMAPFEEEDLPLILKYPQMETLVGSLSHLEALLKGKQNQNWWRKKTSHFVHVKFDVGLSRFGFEQKDVDLIVSFFKKQKFLKLKAVCGHLSQGADGALPQGETQKQISYFGKIYQKIKEDFPNVKSHLLSSSALISDDVHQMKLQEGARIGGCLYGIKHKVDFQNEESQKRWTQLDLKPVVSLKTKIVDVRHIQAGQRVSYEGEWKALQPSVIGIVSVGYEEGLVQYKNHFVLFRGKRVPVVGKICMNFLMIDITGFKEPKRGEEIVIFGKQEGNQIFIEEWCLPKESPYAMLIRVGKHHSKIYKDSK